MKYIAMAFIKGYQYLISPFIPPRCRFLPTCSNYALEAMEEHGFLKGSYLGIRRVLRCHPFHEGGFDPVPQKKCNRST